MKASILPFSASTIVSYDKPPFGHWFLATVSQLLITILKLDTKLAIVRTEPASNLTDKKWDYWLSTETRTETM